MKRYILALMISLLFNLFLIGLVSIRLGSDAPKNPSVDLVFDDSEGSLFHDEIGDDDLVSGAGKDGKGNDGKGGSGLSDLGSNEKPASREQSLSEHPSPKTINIKNELNKAELPFTPEIKSNMPKTAENEDDKILQSNQATSNGGSVPAKSQPAKTVENDSSGSHGASDSGSGLGGGKNQSNSETGSGNDEGSGKMGTSKGGSGSSNGSGGGDSSNDTLGNGSGRTQLSQPVLIKSLEPEYPKEAREKKWEGRTYLKLTIDSKGHVVEVKVLESSGYEVLDEAALKAARRLRYKPASRNGIAVKCYITKAFTFKLQQEE